MRVYQKTYQVAIEGTTPFIMHRDDVEWSDNLEAWRKHPDNKKLSRAGDDRSPAWTWIGYAYHDGHTVGIAVDNIMRTIRDGGAMVLVPGAKSNKTFKSQSQSGIVVNESLWPIIGPKGAVKWADVAKLIHESDFSKHQSFASANGFELFVKRAKVGQSKHVRVRPKFYSWRSAGTVTVIDEQITADVLDSILRMTGMFKGLCDWRPGAPISPGHYGKFVASITEV